MNRPRLVDGARLQYDDVRDLLGGLAQKGLVVDAGA